MAKETMTKMNILKIKHMLPLNKEIPKIKEEHDINKFFIGGVDIEEDELSRIETVLKELIIAIEPTQTEKIRIFKIFSKEKNIPLAYLMKKYKTFNDEIILHQKIINGITCYVDENKNGYIYDKDGIKIGCKKNMDLYLF